MRSLSSRRKSDSKVKRDDVERLLRNGATIKSPSPDIVAAAEHVASLGLIAFEIAQVVLCANPEDKDFGRGPRTCSGRIVVSDDHDDSKAQLCCPACDRRVYPDHFEKRRIREMRSRISSDGVSQYCREMLTEIDSGVKAVSTGAFRLDLDGSEIYTCVIDILTDATYWSQSWAGINPVCYIAVNPNHARFPDGDWLTKVSLAELVCGELRLHEVLQSVAARGRPRDVPQASPALFGKGPTHTVVDTIGDHEVPARRLRSRRNDQELASLRLDLDERIAELPDERHREFMQRLKHDSISQIARDMDVPPTTLNSWLRKVRQKFEDTGLQDYL